MNPTMKSRRKPGRAKGTRTTGKRRPRLSRKAMLSGYFLDGRFTPTPP